MGILVGAGRDWLMTSMLQLSLVSAHNFLSICFLAEQVVAKGNACGQESLRRAQEHLSDVVLIVSFADDATARNASSFVRDLYGRFFLQVIVCAPTEDVELGIKGQGSRAAAVCFRQPVARTGAGSWEEVCRGRLLHELS